MTSLACSVHGRRSGTCTDCRTLARMYDRRRAAKIADGTWLRAVDASEAQAHLDDLIAAGATIAGIAEAANLPRSSVLGVRKRQWVQGPTAEALFAVKVGEGLPSGPAGMVPVVGAARRIQGLAWMGWALQAQADRVGMHMQQVWQIAHTKQEHILHVTDGTFRMLFEDWSATRGPSKRAHTAAVRNAWLPPLAWDDIDDPNAAPDGMTDDGALVDEVAVRRFLDGDRVELNGAEKAAALRLDMARGTSFTAACRNVSVNNSVGRQLLDGTYTTRRDRVAEIDARVAAHSDERLNDLQLSRVLGVHHQTVTRARARLAQRQPQLAG